MSHINGLDLGACPRCHRTLASATIQRGKMHEDDPGGDRVTLSCGCTFHGDDARRIAQTVRAAVLASKETT